MPASDDSRLTIVVTREPRHLWNGENAIFTDSTRTIHDAASAHDVERIILDRSVTCEEFLHLLAALPADVTGDVMFIRHDRGAFLSADARGGGRVLYALGAADVDFYLATHGLTGGRERLALIA
jgi:hypothetical protein